jgi:glyoxylase-like metal-dependent hydrolase (beta-lactamase superfamily II)
MAFADTANEIIASGQAVATMQKYGEDDVKFYAKVTNGTIGPTQLRYPNSILTTGQKRNFGGIDVTFIFSNNGHSPGDILMWLPKQKILFGGDVASSDHMPMITDHGDIPGLIKVLFTVAELHPDIVLTGHGNATTAKSITRDANLLTSLWEIVKENHSNGKMPDETLVEVSAELGPQYEPLYIDFVSEIDRHINLMYQLQ